MRNPTPTPRSGDRKPATTIILVRAAMLALLLAMLACATGGPEPAPGDEILGFPGSGSKTDGIEDVVEWKVYRDGSQVTVRGFDHAGERQVDMVVTGLDEGGARVRLWVKGAVDGEAVVGPDGAIVEQTLDVENLATLEADLLQMMVDIMSHVGGSALPSGRRVIAGADRLAGGPNALRSGHADCLPEWLQVILPETCGGVRAAAAGAFIVGVATFIVGGAFLPGWFAAAAVGVAAAEELAAVVLWLKSALEDCSGRWMSEDEPIDWCRFER